MEWINVALPKGRLGEKVYRSFEAAVPAARVTRSRL